jgi:hypothetical protein
LFTDFHERYLAGNCDGIGEIYNQLVISDEEKEAQALYEYTGCQHMLSAQSSIQSRDFYQAFTDYLTVQREYFGTTLATMSADRITELISDPEPIVADANFCRNLDDFDVAEAPENLQTFVSENWISCAETLRDAGTGLGECTGCSPEQASAIHYSELITYIESNAALYPVDDEAVIDTLLADVMARQAEAVGAGEISLPPGRSIGGTNAVLVIQNAAPQALRIALTGGGASTVESIPVCEDCRTYNGAGPEECPDSDIVSTIELPAGSYSVIVNTTGGGIVTPYVGTWDLEAGTEYFQCFFIVSQ